MIHLQVPATSANLGPGFDLFGVALNRYSQFRIQIDTEERGEIYDMDGAPLGIPPEKNLLWKAYQYTLKRAGFIQDDIPGITVRASMDLPISRGFGSSASALTAGVYLAAQVAHSKRSITISLNEELDYLNELEGHSDNVFPARLGGFVMGYRDRQGKMQAIKRSIPSELGLAVIIPGFNVSTHDSRRTLPRQHSTQNVHSNLTGVCLWMEYLRTEDPKLLTEAIHSDRIHEPYRTEIVPGYDRIHREVIEAGGYGMTLSGSGPGILVYYNRSQESSIIPAIASSLRKIEKDYRQSYPFEICSVDLNGVSTF